MSYRPSEGLGENLRKIATHVTNDFVTSAVNVNFHNGVSTWCYFDEFHIPSGTRHRQLLWGGVEDAPQKGCVPSALTQNVKDLWPAGEIEAILDNTDFRIPLSQGPK